MMGGVRRSNGRRWSCGSPSWETVPAKPTLEAKPQIRTLACKMMVDPNVGNVMPCPWNWEKAEPH